MFLLFFTTSLLIGYSNSCIPSKHFLLDGNVYYVGLYSINVTKNQPDVIGSDTFLKYVYTPIFLQQQCLAFLQCGYIAYEICDNKKYILEVALSIILDIEYNSPSEVYNGNVTKVVVVFTDLAKDVTKYLVSILSNEEISITSELLDNQIFSNRQDAFPFYNPVGKYDQPSIELIDFLNQFSLNNIFVACLTNTHQYNKVCATLQIELEKDDNKCFAVASIYKSKSIDQYMEKLVLQSEKTTVIIIGSFENQKAFFKELEQKKVYNRTLISYGMVKRQYDIYSKEILQFFDDLDIRLKIGLMIFPRDWEEVSIYGLKTLEKNIYDIININQTNNDIENFKNKKHYVNNRYLEVTDVASKVSLVICYVARCSMEKILNMLKVSSLKWFVYLHNVDKNFELVTFLYESFDDVIWSNNQITWTNGAHSPPESVCFQELCSKGNEPLFITKICTHLKNITSKEWGCYKCKPDHIQYMDNSNATCIECPIHMIANSINTKCISIYEDEYFKLDGFISFIPVTISIIGVFLLLLTIYNFVRFGKTTEIKASNKAMSAVQLCFFLCFFIMFPIIIIGRPRPLKCFLRTIVFGYSFNIITAVSIAKSVKLLKIFNAKLRLRKGDILKSKFIDISIIFMFVVVETAITMTGFIIKPPDVIVVKDIERKKNIMYCNTNIHIILQIMLTFVIFFTSFFQSCRVRKLPEVYSDVSEMVYSTLIAEFVIALFFPLYFSRTDENGRIYVIFLMMNIMALSFYSILFYKKIFLRRQRNNADISIKVKTMQSLEMKSTVSKF